MSRTKGIVFAALSAILFGLSPTIATMIFRHGGSPATAVFLRGFLSLPVMLAYILFKKIPLRMTARQWIDLLLLGGIGVAGTGFSLSVAYTYIPGGLATTLHFIYPALTALAGWVFYKERLGRMAILALSLITAGVVLFSAGTIALQPLGITLALFSGFTYAFFTIYIGHSSLGGQNVFALNFYLMAVSTATYGVLGLLGGTLTFGNLTPTGWLYGFLSAMLVSVCAFSLFQMGVRYAGSSTTAMISALEPATSVVCGFLIVGEVLSRPEIAGCVLVLAGISLLVTAKSKAAPAADTPSGKEA